jgi:hypothetical protein
LLVFAMAAAIAILIYLEIPRVAFEHQREQEGLLVDRGEQFIRAIQLYAKKLNKYPQTLDDLDKSQNIRFLRRRYKDPMTGSDEWRLIHVDTAGQYTDSKVHKKAGALDTVDKGPSVLASTIQGIGAGATLIDQSGEANSPALQRRASDRIIPGTAPGAGASGGNPDGSAQPAEGAPVPSGTGQDQSHKDPRPLPARPGRRRHQPVFSIIHFCPRRPSPRPQRSRPIRPAAARPVKPRRGPACRLRSGSNGRCRREEMRRELEPRPARSHQDRGPSTSRPVRAARLLHRRSRPFSRSWARSVEAQRPPRRAPAQAVRARARWERVWSAWPARRNSKAFAATRTKRTTRIGNSSSTRARPRRIRAAVLEPALPRARPALLPALPTAVAVSAGWAAALRRRQGLRAISRLAVRYSTAA